MNIHITKDEEYIKNIPDRITSEQLEQAENLIRELFEKSITQLYGQVLQAPYPDDVEILFKHDDPDETISIIQGKLLGRLSTPSSLQFVFFDHALFGDKINLHAVILHELVHAADLTEIKKGIALFDKMQEQFDDHKLYDDYDSCMGVKEIYRTLRLLSHYRNEGIAILCSNVLRGLKIFDENETHRDSLKFFGKINLLMFNTDIIKDEFFDMAYSIAASVLLEALSARGDISSSIADKVRNGMNTGNYELTTEEIRSLVCACKNLSLTSYIQGLLLSHEDKQALIPVYGFLSYCSKLDTNNPDLLAIGMMARDQQYFTNELFTNTMKNIMYEALTPKELKQHYRKFCRQADDQDPAIKEKVDKLYNAFTNLPKGDMKNLVQWTLTYFFNELDVINDDVPIYGMVDDLIVIDTALHILENHTSAPLS